jgi:hypothetical protein
MSSPSYKAPVAVTGHRLDGPGQVLFVGSPHDQPSTGWSVPGLNGYFEPGAVAMPSSGGYEWDVNGHRFHYKFVLQRHRREGCRAPPEDSVSTASAPLSRGPPLGRSGADAAPKMGACLRSLLPIVTG